MSTERGLILKGVGGFYTILTDSGSEVVCRARGRFRLDGISPVCGDYVELEHQQEGDAAITKILPRRSLLERPAVANIDRLIIVLSASKPKPDFMLADKLIIASSPHNIEPLIVLNKTDTAGEGDTQAAAAQYSSCYSVICVSAHTGHNMDELRAALKGHICCFAGQSAVGKSSLMNALIPELSLPVGGLSRKASRGRHTTRHAQLWPFMGGALLDTPGFSLLELKPMTQDELNAAYREFKDAPKDCRFSACAHRSEPDCAVKALITSGKLSNERYLRYVEISEGMEEMMKHVYD